MPHVELILVHYPVMGKGGETIGASVTNLDLHDISRSAKTYGVRALHVVTPYVDQQRLVREIVGHWVDGPGKEYNPCRREALQLIRVAGDVDAVVVDASARLGVAPLLVATCARRQKKSIAYRELRLTIDSGQPVLLLFGTAWGLGTAVMERAGIFLPPLEGTGAYNHLSVRAAAAIVLDRLLGCV